MFLGESISYTIEKLSETCKDDNCLNQCSDVLCMGLCEHLHSCDYDDPANLCKDIHKLHSNLVSKKTHVNTDAEIINELTWLMLSNALHDQMILKKTQENNNKKKFEENISNIVALMEKPTVKSLRLASVNSILSLNRQSANSLLIHSFEFALIAWNITSRGRNPFEQSKLSNNRN